MIRLVRGHKEIVIWVRDTDWHSIPQDLTWIVDVEVFEPGAYGRYDKTDVDEDD